MIKIQNVYHEGENPENKKEGSVFYRNSKGEKIYSKMEDGEELPQGYKRTMGENYRRSQYRRRY